MSAGELGLTAKMIEALDEETLVEKLDLGRSLRPGQVPLALVSTQLDALEDAEYDIEAELAELDIIDLACEQPILSDAARRVMQFAQLSKFLQAGMANQLGATRRSVYGEGPGEVEYDGPDFSIGDLHQLVLDLPSVPVDKLRKELDLIGGAARRLEDVDADCIGRTTLKKNSAALVAAARS